MAKQHEYLLVIANPQGGDQLQAVVTLEGSVPPQVLLASKTPMQRVQAALAAGQLRPFIETDPSEAGGIVTVFGIMHPHGENLLGNYCGSCARGLHGGTCTCGTNYPDELTPPLMEALPANILAALRKAGIAITTK